nr:site-specific integrase [Nitrosomonas nitrosa]
MPRNARNKLTATQVKRVSKPGLYPDGAGLFLQVTTGIDGEPRKSWVLRYRSPAGRPREMGLGSIGVVDLVRARTKAEAARALVESGVDPIEQRKLERVRAATAEATTVTFKQAAERFLDAHKDSWKNPKHRQQWENTLKNYVYDVFGSVPVAAVDRNLVLRVVEPIWKTKTETASRVRSRIERVLDWAKARGLRTGENPAQWKGGLSHVLPARNKAQRVKHHAALAFADMPAFMSELRQRNGLSAKALEFTILTAARTNEALRATWQEIDLQEGVWTIPATRMKASREHRVPLSESALALLRPLKIGRPTDWVFPGYKKGKPLSDMTLLAMLKSLGRGDLTVHGFRSTFRDWAAERTDFAREVAEAALAHTVRDKVEAAYRRGDLFAKRRELMRQWAEYCDAPHVTEGAPAQSASE